MAVQASAVRFVPSTGPRPAPALRRRSSTPRNLVRLGVAALVLLAVSIASLTIGARSVGIGTMIDAVTAFDPSNGEHAVVLSRVPRTIVGLLVGAALATAGAALMETGAGSETDLATALDGMLPSDDRWVHRHGSPGHGRSHVMPALLPPYATIPVEGGELQLGTWQSVCLVDLNVDNAERAVRLDLLSG